MHIGWLQNRWVHNSAKLLSANVIAQVIGICVYPLLTRLYTPADFGLFNLFLSIGGVLLLFATGEFYSAIVLPKHASQAQACFQVGMVCNVVVTLLCLLSVPFAAYIANLFNAPILADWYYLLPFYVFVMASWQLLNYWYIRHKQFGFISSYQVGQSVLNASLKSVFGWLGWLQGGLIVASLLAPLLSLCGVLAASYRSCQSLLRLRWHTMRQMAVAYRKFPQYSLPKSVVNYIGGNLPVLLLSPFFSLSDIGYFGMATTLSFLPLSLVAKSFNQVLFSFFAQKVNQQASVYGYYVRFGGAWLVVLAVGLLGLYGWLPWLTQTLLGASWQPVGTYIQYMLPWLGVVTLTNTFDFWLDIFKQQDKQFYVEVLLLLMRTLVLLWAIHRQNFAFAVMGFSLVSCLVRVGYAAYQYYLVSQYEKNRCNCN